MWARTRIVMSMVYGSVVGGSRPVAKVGVGMGFARLPRRCSWAGDGAWHRALGKSSRGVEEEEGTTNRT